MDAQIPSFGSFSEASFQLVVDQAEHARRQDAGIGSVIGYGFGGLATLMSLPEGMPVPVDALTPTQQQYVHGAPAGICTVQDGHVTRHAIRPCRITLATIHARSASPTALNATEQFRYLCARQVVIRQAPTRHRPGQLLEFHYSGVGVALEHPDGNVETLLEPRPWRPQKPHTFDAWFHAERAYAAYLEHSHDTATPRLEGHQRPEGTRR